MLIVAHAGCRAPPLRAGPAASDVDSGGSGCAFPPSRGRRRVTRPRPGGRRAPFRPHGGANVPPTGERPAEDQLVRSGSTAPPVPAISAVLGVSAVSAVSAAFVTSGVPGEGVSATSTVASNAAAPAAANEIV